MPKPMDPRAEPDVSVVIPIYNAMPYLTRCLKSVANQTIGLDRIEVLAVDDGSEDASRAELDTFARSFPGVFTVLHQANSGTPAAPRNMALNLARGRYVFFLDSDDYLGLDALRRLVERADQWHSDVIFGTMVGENGRVIWQEIFKSTESDVEFYASGLPFTLASTKMYRREMIEKFGLRFPEDMAIGEDQPFAIEAFVRSRRTSVVNDYEYYHAVKRDDASNVSSTTSPMERLRCTAQIMDFVADLIDPGERRDAVLLRHFQWELTEQLQYGFVEAEEKVQRALCAQIAVLADKYCTDAIRDTLPVFHRLRIGLARSGEMATLKDVIRAMYGPERQAPPFVSDGQRILLGYPGLNDAVISDRYYEQLDHKIAKSLGKRAQFDLSLERGFLDLRVTLPVIERAPCARSEIRVEPVSSAPKSIGSRRLRVGHCAGKTLVSAALMPSVPNGSSLRFGVDLRILSVLERGQTAAIRLHVSVGGTPFDFPVPAKDCAGTLSPRLRRRIRLIEGAHGELLVWRQPRLRARLVSFICRAAREFENRVGTESRRV